MNENSGNQVITRKRFRDKHKEKRIYEHLTNENDIISEEDIQRVISDSSITSYNTHIETYHKSSNSSRNSLRE